MNGNYIFEILQKTTEAYCAANGIELKKAEPQSLPQEKTEKDKSCES